MIEPKQEATPLIEREQIDSLIAAAGVDGAGEIMTAFWGSTDDLIAALRGALASGAADDARKVAHALKGSASNVGAQALSQTALDFENQCRDGALTDEASDALEAVVACYAHTKDAFTAYFANAA